MCCDLYGKKQTERNFLQLVLCNMTGFDYSCPLKEQLHQKPFKKGTVQEWMRWIYAKAFSNYAEHYASPAHPSTRAKIQ